MAVKPPRRESRSALQVLELVGNVLPLVRILRRRLALDDRFPELGEVGVERGELPLLVRNIVLGEDRLDRALRNAERAIDALVGIDDEEVGALAEAIDGAYVDAVGVLAADAAFGDDVGHDSERRTGGNGGQALRPRKLES